ncbi:NTP transferase domain-containing protein [bacterium]|nr:NTP transferase domain-containing protein [bacterium]
MKAIIPTAGVGSRLQPFTHTVPKVLLQVADKAILGHILDSVIQEGIHEVTFVVGYLGEMIEEYVTENYPQIQAHFVEQEEAKGLGHAIYLTRAVHADETEPVVIILGDTILQANLSVLKDAPDNMIGVCEVDNPQRFGIVELDGDYVSNMVEKPDKPRSNLAIVGIYFLKNLPLLYRCLEENIENRIKTKDEYQLTDALQLMLDKGSKMKAFPVKGWYDCGKPETLLATNRTLLEMRFPNNKAELEARYETVRVRPPVYIAEGARVSDSIIGPYVTIGKDCVVDSSIVTNSIINQDARLRGVLLADSIIGNDAQVEARAIRLYVGDKSEVIYE